MANDCVKDGSATVFGFLCNGVSEDELLPHAVAFLFRVGTIFGDA
jgi:hypothetical protein